MKVIDHMILCHGKLNCYYDRILITLGYWAIVGVKRMLLAQSFQKKGEAGLFKCQISSIS